MGFLNLETDDDDKRYLPRIKSALKRRGLRPDIECDWEIHGPHYPDMPYYVLIGTAYNEEIDEIYVAIYPHAVYQIDTPDDWWRCDPEMRLKVGEEL